MSQASKQPSELIYHIQAESKVGYEHDDEDAWNWLQEHKAEIEAAGGQVTFNRSFGSRSHDGTRTTIVLISPSDPKKAVKPENFFADTNLVHFEISQYVDPNAPPELPKGASVVQNAPAPDPEVKFNVAG